MKKIISPAAVLAAAAVMSACYSSVQTQRDAAADPRQDTQDAGEPDGRPDVPPDVVQDLPADVVHDVYPDYPSSGMDFIVRNLSNEMDGRTFYFTVWPYISDTLEYPFEVMRFEGDMAEILYLYHPWCSVDCEDVDDPVDCCIPCPPPLSDVLLPLETGQYFSFHWDGTLFRITMEPCECGCSQEFLAPPADYGVTICAYTDMTCYGETCAPDENGIIWNAAGAGEYFCSRHEIITPYDYGSVFYFDFPPYDR